MTCSGSHREKFIHLNALQCFSFEIHALFAEDTGQRLAHFVPTTRSLGIFEFIR